MIQGHLQHLERSKSLRFSGTHFALLFNLPTPGKRPLTLPSPPGEGIRFPVFSCQIPFSPGHMLPSFGICCLLLKGKAFLFPLPGGEGRVRGLFTRGVLKGTLFPIRVSVEKRKTHPCLTHKSFGRSFFSYCPGRSRLQISNRFLMLAIAEASPASSASFRALDAASAASA